MLPHVRIALGLAPDGSDEVDAASLPPPVPGQPRRVQALNPVLAALTAAGIDPAALARVVRKLDFANTPGTGANSGQARLITVPGAQAGTQGTPTLLLAANIRRKSCLLVPPASATNLYLGLNGNFGLVQAQVPAYGFPWEGGTYLGTQPDEYTGEFWALNLSTTAILVGVLEYVTGDPTTVGMG